MKLSHRLNAILDFIDPCDVLVDIGTDHGYVIIKAIIENKCKKAYGLDIASGPLRFAKDNVLNASLEDKIELMQMNGLEDFNQDADTFVIAGMGHETILSILDQYTFNPKQTLILQSNTKIYALRQALNNRGFEIVDETFLIDNHKPTTILKCRLNHQILSVEDIYLGPHLKKQNNTFYLMYLKEKMKKLERVVGFNASLKKEVDIYKEFIQKQGA